MGMGHLDRSRKNVSRSLHLGDTHVKEGRSLALFRVTDSWYWSLGRGIAKDREQTRKCPWTQCRWHHVCRTL